MCIVFFERITSRTIRQEKKEDKDETFFVKFAEKFRECLALKLTFVYFR